MPDTKTLWIDLADLLPDPHPPLTEYEFTVEYAWSEYRPARYYPWPGEPEEPAELEIETCASDVVQAAWLWYENQFAGLPTVDRTLFIEMVIKELAAVIDNADYTPDSAPDDDGDYLYECWRDRQLGV